MLDVSSQRVLAATMHDYRDCRELNTVFRSARICPTHRAAPEIVDASILNRVDEAHGNVLRRVRS